MNQHATMLSALVLSLLAAEGCGRRDPVEAPVVSPASIADFDLLYATNCEGCHGKDGRGGAAAGLADPVYLAIAGDDTIRRVAADGVPGTSMPAFAQRSGGTLTDNQIEAIVRGIRRWAKPDALGNASPPPHTAKGIGDATRGAQAYASYCASCHGAGGRGGERAGPIVDSSFLALVSDQSLRTTVIAGRPDLGSPDWRHDRADEPMSAEEVSDVVAWLAAHRTGGEAP